MNPEKHISPLRSYGRRKGRKLKASQSGLIETLLPKLLIKLTAHRYCPSREGGNLSQDPRLGRGDKGRHGDNYEIGIFPSDSKPLWFEIGFGGGEHLVEQARRNPGVNFIGCEPYINGMASLLSLIDRHKLDNVRLYDGDAREVLELLPDASLERVFLLFPDPWPKARHHKRRLVSRETLELVFNKLQPGGLLRIATDHADYGVWMLEQLLAFGKMQWTAKGCADWETSPADWVTTRYQAKALDEGRGAIFLDWCKPHSNPVTKF